MPLSVLPSFIYYCFIQAITPGPANLTSLSTALRMGRRAALRQWRGLFTGFTVVALTSALLTWLVGTGLTEYVHWLTWVGAAYIIYMAVRILLDDGKPHAEKKKSAFAEGTFLNGLAVQLTNVKIMVFCVTALTGYVLPYTTRLGSLLLVGCLLPFTGPMCNLIWLFAGSSLQKLFAGHKKLIDVIMALSLIACALRMVL